MRSKNSHLTRHVAAVMTLAEADRVAAFARAERRSVSASLALLAGEALDARGFAPDAPRGGANRPGQGGEADPAGREALSGFPGVSAVRR